MSDTNDSGFDWSDITGQAATAPPAPRGSAAATYSLPPFPQGFSYMVGRLPLKQHDECSMPGSAIIQLPEATAGVSCAMVLPNAGVLSDCYTDGSEEPVANPVHARPINDREIKVFFAKGSSQVKGLGWDPGEYQGSQPTTRAIGVGVPYVEVMLIIGPDCGCDTGDWAPDNPYPQ